MNWTVIFSIAVKKKLGCVSRVKLTKLVGHLPFFKVGLLSQLDGHVEKYLYFFGVKYVGKEET